MLPCLPFEQFYLDFSILREKKCPTDCAPAWHVSWNLATTTLDAHHPGPQVEQLTRRTTINEYITGVWMLGFSDHEVYMTFTPEKY